MKFRNFIYPLLFIFPACKVVVPVQYTDERLHVLNYSDKNVYAMFSLNYPDTLFKVDPGEPISFPVQQGNIPAYPRCITLSKNGSWDDFFKSKSPDFKIHIFIFHADVIENVGWNEVLKKQLYIRRIDLTHDELKSRKWDVIFQY